MSDAGREAIKKGHAKRKGTDGNADDEGMGPVSPSQRRSNRSR